MQGDGAAVASTVAGVGGVVVVFWHAVIASPSRLAKKMQLIAVINL